jgi:hypothetical protein
MMFVDVGDLVLIGFITAMLVALVLVLRRTR